MTPRARSPSSTRRWRSTPGSRCHSSARTLLLAGRAHRRSRQRRVARTLLEEARTQFASHGAHGWARRAEDELNRVGGRTPAGEELTATERRVADLVAAGLSNREVAERAFLSVKTVEANLTRVYRKLGVGSRSALVRAMAIGDGEAAEPAEPGGGDGRPASGGDGRSTSGGDGRSASGGDGRSASGGAIPQA